MDLITLHTQHATATISSYGGQVLGFGLANQPGILWENAPQFVQAAQAEGKAMRAGIPLCWPWFLKSVGHPNAPSHGYARLRHWNVDSVTTNAATLSLQLDGTEEAYPHKTSAILTVTLTDKLDIALATTNLAGVPIPLQQALHTYLNVGDAAQVKVHGLQGLQRVHITPAVTEAPLDAPLTINGEVEHLFSPVAQTICVEDPVLGRTLCVAMRGGEQAVVWNPGAEKAKGLDMEPESYKTMLCVEAANIGRGSIAGEVTLQPGQTHTLATTLWSEKL